MDHLHQMAICIHYHGTSYSLLLSIDVVVVVVEFAVAVVAGCCSKIDIAAAAAAADSLVASIAVVPKLEVEE
jgi:hypothetical protein